MSDASQDTAAADILLRTDPAAAPGARSGAGQLVILGMHRSGTSMLTGALALCGAWTGAEDELTEANAENPKGFWERRDLRTICNTLLEAAGADWWRAAEFDPARVPEDVRTEQVAAFTGIVETLNPHAPWVVKEPRLCILLPLLAPALDAPVCVLVHRDPLEVARSLTARNGFGILEGLALWEAYTRRALEVSADLPRVMLRHADLMRAPAETLTRLVARLGALGVTGLKVPDAATLRDFITPDLHRQHATGDETTDLLTPAQARLWSALAQDPEPLATAIDAALAEALSPAARQILHDLDARHLARRALEDETALRHRTETTLKSAETRIEAGKQRIENLEATRDRLRGARNAAARRIEALETAHESSKTALLASDTALKASDTALKASDTALKAARLDISRLRVSRAQIQTQRDAVQKEFSKVLRSTAWRITGPLRFSGQALKDARRGLTGGTSALRDAAQGLRPTPRQSGRIGQLRRWFALARAERLVRASGLFDLPWYLTQHPEAARAGRDPLRHFLAAARREGLNPSPEFDTMAYMRAYPDVARAGVNPLVHYLRHGRALGRRIFRVPKRESDAASPFDPMTAHQWTETLRADPAHTRLVAGLNAPGAEPSADAPLAEPSADAPLVTVIIPTRDRKALLPQAIESVRAQSYDRWELIVVDDGSTDGTQEHIRETFDDPRLRILRTEGIGVSGARNAGLEAAQGALIAYLDSDNFWMPDYLELMLTEFARSGADCVYSVLKVREETEGKPPSMWHRARPFDFEALKISNYIDLNIFMHRADLVARHGMFDTSLKRAVDWDLILRYVRDEKVSFANFVGAEYDHSDRSDRLTVRELYAYKNVVRNKHWIDWEAQEAELADRDADRVSVVMCLQGPADETEARLAALFTHPAGEEFELIIVDNTADAVSKAILSDWAARTPDLHLVEPPENVHISLGSNLGFAASRGSQVVFLSDRIEVSPEWLRALVRPLKDRAVRGAQAKIVGPDGTIRSTGLAFSAKGALAYPLHAGAPGDFGASNRPQALPAIGGGCAVFRAEDLVRVRGFNPLFSTEQQDADLSLRIGGGAAVFRSVPDAVVRWHPGGLRIRPHRIEADRRQFVAAWTGRTPSALTPDGAEDDAFHPDVPAWADDGIAIWQPGAPPARQNGADPATAAEAVPPETGAPAAALPAALSSITGRTIALKIGCPRPDMKDHWGDYHFAVALAAAFLRKGLTARIDFAADPDRHAQSSDINLILRGRQRFHPSRGTLNLMWLISHPDRVSIDEMRGFDHVFIASRIWADEMAQTPDLSCEALLQCTDSSRFYPEAADPAVASRALFVANSRNVLRTVVREAIEQDLPIDIYGEMWDGLAPPEWIRAEKIENVDLPRHYASAEVVLNDHWDSMRENGFVSNRIFDVLACGAPLVTDRVAGLPAEIAEGCTFFGDGISLTEAVETARGARNPARARARADLVHSRHSFDARAGTIAAVIEAKLAAPRPATLGAKLVGRLGVGRAQPELQADPQTEPQPDAPASPPAPSKPSGNRIAS